MTIDRERLRAAALPAALYIVAVAFSVWHLVRLQHPYLAVWQLAGWALLALAPALVAVAGPAQETARRYVLALAVAAVAAIGVATGHWPFAPHLLGHHGYFARVWGDLSRGLDAWLRVTLPYDPVRHPELKAMVALTIFAGFAALAALLVTWRAPFPALIVAFLPFLVVSTVYVLPDATFRGALMLAIGLAFVATIGRDGRPAGSQRGLVGGMVVALAIAAAAMPGVAKGAFFDWQHWTAKERTGASVAFVWNHDYGALHRPPRPIPLLRVHSTVPSYYRAVVLEKFDGIGWDVDATTAGAGRAPAIATPPGQLSPAARRAPAGSRLSVQYENVGLDEPYLLTAGEPVRVSNVSSDVGAVSISTASVFAVEHAPALGERWQSEGIRLDPKLSDLINSGTSYPLDLQRRDLSLLDNAAVFPPWGQEGREQAVQVILAQRFYDRRTRDWQEVYKRARKIVDDAKARTPYEATAAIEDYFQTNFSYDEHADYAGAANGPLPAFFLSSRRAGYCQDFSGAMAVMLRMLGIPARVAEGFTQGTFDPKAHAYTITDRDAHSWVEVAFPGYGWLSFEPTPTRSLTFGFSSTAADFGDRLKRLGRSNPFASVFTSRGSKGSPTRQRKNDDRVVRPSRPVVAPAARPWRPGVSVYVLLTLAGLLLVLALAKRVRLARSYLARDPQAIATAVRADLVAFVSDQGLGGSIAALTPAELSARLRAEFDVDASRWAAQQMRARYGRSGDGALRAARDARREARRVKHDLRRGLTARERARGAVRVRSLLP